MPTTTCTFLAYDIRDVAFFSGANAATALGCHGGIFAGRAPLSSAADAPRFLQLKTGACPQPMRVNDSAAAVGGDIGNVDVNRLAVVEDPRDGNQVLQAPGVIEGGTWGAGTQVDPADACWLTPVGGGAGITIYPIQHGNDTIVGFAATGRLQSGTRYGVARVMPDSSAPNSSELSFCFAGDVAIRTVDGDVAARDLSVGDRVLTMDEGYQAILWIGSRRIGPEELASSPALRPVRIRQGALGCGLPERDLLVSPQHRVLVRSRIARTMFDQDEVLVAARQLVGMAGIEIAEELASVDYVHFLLDRHQIVFAEGAPAESLFTGPEALRAAGADAMTELFTILPELADVDATALAAPARLRVAGRPARAMAQRHRDNRVALFAAE